MEVDAYSLVFICMIILIGYYVHMIWLSFIFAGVFLCFLLAARKKPEPVAVPAGPKIRPIVVKRRYVGPESIYPRKQLIRVTEPGWWENQPWWEFASKNVGKGIGFITRKGIDLARGGE